MTRGSHLLVGQVVFLFFKTSFLLFVKILVFCSLQFFFFNSLSTKLCCWSVNVMLKVFSIMFSSNFFWSERWGSKSSSLKRSCKISILSKRPCKISMKFFFYYSFVKLYWKFSTYIFNFTSLFIVTIIFFPFLGSYVYSLFVKGGFLHCFYMYFMYNFYFTFFKVSCF